MFSTKNFTIGSIIAYSITFAFLGLAVFFTISASSQDQAFISSELGLATFSPNGPSGGMLVAASGHSGTETNPPSNYPPSNYPPSNYPPSNYPPSSYTSPPTSYPPSSYPPSSYTTTPPPPSSYPPPPPPRPSISVSTIIPPSPTIYSDSPIYIAPSDDVRIRWTSSNASSCSLSDSQANLGVTGTSNTTGYLVTPNLDPGGSEVYTVSCNGPGGSRSRSVTVIVPNIQVDMFVIDPSLIRSGASSTVQWSLSLDNPLTYTPGDDTPYSYLCSISGAVDTQPNAFEFDASTNGGNGSTQTRILSNRSIAVLQCDTFTRADAAVEVIPTSEEI